MSLLRAEVDLHSLLRKCQRGDERAWSALVGHFQSLVYSIPKRMGLSDDDAGDVFQATFMALHRTLDRIESAQTLPKWLGVTASREAIRHIRFKNRGGNQVDDERGLDQIVADEEASAEAYALAGVESDMVRRGMDKLQAKCRDLLGTLFQDEEPSYQEISARLGIAIGAIGPTRARCLEKLRTILKGEGFFE